MYILPYFNLDFTSALADNTSCRTAAAVRLTPESYCPHCHPPGCPPSTDPRSHRFLLRIFICLVHLLNYSVSNNGVFLFECCWCSLPRWEEDRRRILWRYLRRDKSSQQSTGCYQICEYPSRPCHEQPFTGLKEPRKSDAPQLRDEYRTYKILVGCRKSQPHV
jgi:hypothetical protein